jgi:hypothetical protein
MRIFAGASVACEGPSFAVTSSPEDYDTRLDVDFSTLEDERAPAA